MKVLTDCMGLQSVLPPGYVSYYVERRSFLHVLESEQYDVVICSHNGNEALQLVRRVRRESLMIPIIMLCSELSPLTPFSVKETEVLAAGGDYLLPMQTDAHCIKMRIETCL